MKRKHSEITQLARKDDLKLLTRKCHRKIRNISIGMQNPCIGDVRSCTTHILEFLVIFID